MLQDYSIFYRIETPSCPRTSIISLHRVDLIGEDGIEIYWKEHYIGAFSTFLEDLFNSYSFERIVYE